MNECCRSQLESGKGTLGCDDKITIENIENRAKMFIGWLEATGLVKSEVDRKAILSCLIDQLKALYYDIEDQFKQEQEKNLCSDKPEEK